MSDKVNHNSAATLKEKYQQRINVERNSEDLRTHPSQLAQQLVNSYACNDIIAWIGSY